MRITFKNSNEWDDFMSSFNGEKYSFALSLDGSYELLPFEELKYEYVEFPITIEGETDLVQICGVREGEKVTLCSFRELKELARKTGGEALSRVFSLNDWYTHDKRYADLLSPYLTERLMDSMKRDILTDGQSKKLYNEEF